MRWASVFKLAEIVGVMGVKAKPSTLSPEVVATLEVLLLSR